MFTRLLLIPLLAATLLAGGCANHNSSLPYRYSTGSDVMSGR